MGSPRLDVLTPLIEFQGPQSPTTVARGRVRVAAAAGLLVILAGLIVAVRAGSASDLTREELGAPMRAANGAAIGTFTTTEGGLRSGDVVVAVNGMSVAGRSLPHGRIGDRFIYRVRRGDQLLDIAVTLRPYPLGAALAQNWPTLLLVVLGAVHFYVFARRPDDRAARALLIVGASAACAAPAWVFGLGVLDTSGGPTWWANLGANLALAVLWGAVLHLTLVFPEPRGVVARQPRLVGLAYLLPFALYGLYLAGTLPGASTPLQRAGLVTSTVVLTEYVMPALVGVTLVRAYRGVTESGARQRLRWVMAWFAGSIAGWLGLWKLPGLLGIHPLIRRPMHILLFVPCPLALAFAVLRHQLFDINIAIRRSVVYASLTACVVGIYTLTVGLLSRLVPNDSPLVSLAGTGVVAVAFSPLHRRLQQGVSRLFYGERDDPYQIVSRLGQHLETTQTPMEVLPGVVDTVAYALRLPYVAVELAGPNGTELAAQHGTPGSDTLSADLAYQGRTIGRLVVGERSPGEGFGPADRRLLDGLAAQVGVAAHAVIVTRDLQRSRQRLVTAREEERRRLRRDLHDGVGPSLGAAVLQLQVAKRLVRADPDEAESLITQLAKQTQATIADIRHLVDDLRPPALDQLGLVAALQEQASSFDRIPAGLSEPGAFQVAVHADGEFAGMPAAVEVAAFRIVSEAMNNASRHGRATSCVVRLVLNESLEVEVSDDGCGLPLEYRPGVGLDSMRERAAELGGTCTIEAVPGGGTMVRARLPLPAQ